MENADKISCQQRNLQLDSGSCSLLSRHIQPVSESLHLPGINPNGVRPEDKGNSRP